MIPRVHYSLSVETVCPRFSVSDSIYPKSVQNLVEDHHRAMRRSIMSLKNLSQNGDQQEVREKVQGKMLSTDCYSFCPSAESRASEAHQPHTSTSVTHVFQG